MNSKRKSCLIGLAILVGMGIVVYIPFQYAQETSLESTCESSMKQAVMATLAYADDHGHHLPPVRDWWATIQPYHPDKDGCPLRSCQNEIGYAMSAELSGQDLRKIAHPETTILLYEACGGVPEYRHRGGMFVAYVDGHPAWVPGPKK